MVAYELMNEPVADDPEQWNNISGQAGGFDPPVGARADDCYRIKSLAVGNTFDKLRIPKNDRSILLSFHFYEPFFLTHYQGFLDELEGL